MPAKNPRLNIVIEEPIYKAIHDLSETNGISMSTVARDLIREALELREDAALAAFAEEREKSLKKSKMLSHRQVWK
jgi:predicted DNA-binding protein